MTTLPTKEDDDLFGELLEVAVTAGFEPADEGPEWIAQRYEGYRSDPVGFLCFNRDDDTFNLYLMTPFGVQLAQATFTLNRLGLAMFAAALNFWEKDTS